jgi:hypothetical protein
LFRLRCRSPWLVTLASGGLLPLLEEGLQPPRTKTRTGRFSTTCRRNTNGAWPFGWRGAVRGALCHALFSLDCRPRLLLWSFGSLLLFGCCCGIWTRRIGNANCDTSVDASSFGLEGCADRETSRPGIAGHCGLSTDDCPEGRGLHGCLRQVPQVRGQLEEGNG